MPITQAKNLKKCLHICAVQKLCGKFNDQTETQHSPSCPEVSTIRKMLSPEIHAAASEHASKGAPNLFSHVSIPCSTLAMKEWLRPLLIKDLKYKQIIERVGDGGVQVLGFGKQFKPTFWLYCHDSIGEDGVYSQDNDLQIAEKKILSENNTTDTNQRDTTASYNSSTQPIHICLLASSWEVIQRIREGKGNLPLDRIIPTPAEVMARYGRSDSDSGTGLIQDDAGSDAAANESTLSNKYDYNNGPLSFRVNDLFTISLVSRGSEKLKTSLAWLTLDLHMFCGLILPVSNVQTSSEFYKNTMEVSRGSRAKGKNGENGNVISVQDLSLDSNADALKNSTVLLSFQDYGFLWLSQTGSNSVAITSNSADITPNASAPPDSSNSNRPPPLPIPALFHFAFESMTNELCAESHACALQKGGKCNGPPGLRKLYSNWMYDFFGAYFTDPDGYHCETCHVWVHLGVGKAVRSVGNFLGGLLGGKKKG